MNQKLFLGLVVFALLLSACSSAATQAPSAPVLPSPTSALAAHPTPGADHSTDFNPGRYGCSNRRADCSSYQSPSAHSRADCPANGTARRASF